MAGRLPFAVTTNGRPFGPLENMWDQKPGPVALAMARALALSLREDGARLLPCVMWALRALAG